MAAESNIRYKQSLHKIHASSDPQPNAIPTAGAPDAAPLATRHSGCAAVDECVEAYNEAFRATLAKTKAEFDARKAAANAYRQAMPALSGSHNIAHFIACVAHGLVLGAIQGNDASRLIYAAQVAHTANPIQSWIANEPRRAGRPSNAETLKSPSLPAGKPWHWSEDLKRYNEKDSTPAVPEIPMNE